MSLEVSEKASQLRSLKSIFDSDSKEFELLHGEGILSEEELRAQLDTLEKVRILLFLINSELNLILNKTELCS
jgi:hypothetical protein